MNECAVYEDLFNRYMSYVLTLLIIPCREYLENLTETLFLFGSVCRSKLIEMKINGIVMLPCMQYSVNSQYEECFHFVFSEIRQDSPEIQIFMP